MADSRKTLDVWIVETNTVYKAVPFTVVADWLQQGRLLEDDQVRPAGSGAWARLAGHPDFRAYLPHAEPMRADDQAEALQSVRLDFAWKKPADEDDDVDMIPLIDISLVLLIFFMMTATVAIGGALISVPQTEHGSEMNLDPTMVWVGIDRDRDGNAVYSIGEGQRPAEADDSQLAFDQLLLRLDRRLQEADSPVDVRVAAHEDLPYEVVQKLTVELEKRRTARRVQRILSEVTEKNR
jgi:biopolymer transport protein ExbD